MKTIAVILAGGKGTRMHSAVNKVLLPVKGVSVIRRSVEAFIHAADLLVIVCRPEEESAIRKEIGDLVCVSSVLFAAGGETRQQSVFNGLQKLSCDPEDLVLIHDAARCLVDGSLIARVIDSVRTFGSGIPAVPAKSTFKLCDDRGYILRTPDRSHLFEAQTPQGFLAETIVSAYRKAAQDGYEGTDDSCLLEHYGIPVRIVDGDESNLKITTPADIRKAAVILEGAVKPMRIGMGYDVHRLVENRDLILCGVKIPYESGLLGHSDADVALHALMDAMLGACALGDIGKHFPDTDPRYKGISSMALLEKTRDILSENRYRVCNLDITIVAQQPRLLPYIPRMIENVASVLSLPEKNVSIKATTTEKLGFEGRQEGISAYAVCSVYEDGTE